MGYGWIAQEEAEKIQVFYKRVLNVYLNYHRPCGYATEVLDRKGKVRKRYDAYLTPYEKLRNLPQAEQYVRPPKATATPSTPCPFSRRRPSSSVPSLHVPSVP